MCGPSELAFYFVCLSLVVLYGLYEDITYFKTFKALISKDAKPVYTKKTVEANCLDKTFLCKGAFEYVEAIPHMLDNNDDTQILPYSDNPQNVNQCVREWKNIDYVVGNKQKPKSSHNEDITIWEKYFGGGPVDGYFLEMGAFDGIAESNTRFFERCLGWNGLLIEANPTPFKTLRQSRPRAKKLLLAPSCESETTVKFNPTPFTNAKTETVRSRLGKTTPNFVEVHCGPLGSYLDTLGIYHIDFFSLDVEGSELAVLKTIDFSKLTIKVLMVESKNAYNPGGDSEQNVAVKNYLEQFGYKREPQGTIKASDVYILH